ncbi:hypothetical protein GobsT_63570 [Gemmata obscuriglobus]|uniref:Uncharacterized protein n=1 Tax=Gemmata obscuriglobus TaxID=114 RepID=A0A2Z3H4I6_9BACT|nr:hypothetical protein C1280_02045 [Gemmata obscuriglobus]QEG31535.1 hypothetical protein GobsT_63570 [Gemmata obscuriglobus]VTS10877.1 unnamed protein product [Gemmata obscuriglobus UQM 2246]
MLWHKKHRLLACKTQKPVLRAGGEFLDAPRMGHKKIDCLNMEQRIGRAPVNHELDKLELIWPLWRISVTYGADNTHKILAIRGTRHHTRRVPARQTIRGKPVNIVITPIFFISLDSCHLGMREFTILKVEQP